MSGLSNSHDIVVLVRSATDDTARERVEESLQKRELPSVEVRSGLGTGGVFAVASDLAQDLLGLAQGTYRALVARTVSIIHV